MPFRFTHASYLLLVGSIVLTQNVQATEDAVLMTSAECLQDIDFTAQFLLENDAGIRAQKWTTYPENIQQILNTQKEKAAQVQTAKQCEDIAKPFIKSIRKGHLWLNAQSIIKYVQSSSASQEDNLIKTEKLSDSTTYIFIPSFFPSIKDQLAKIINSNQDDLLKAPYLIIDLRKNKGGVDSSAEPIYPILGEAEYWSETPQIYASPATVQAWKDVQKSIHGGSSNKELMQLIKKVELKKEGWVSLENNKETSLKITGKEILATPKKVAILIDDKCGSSCEEFVKTVRQNPKIVTMGRNTYGALDASNMLEKMTPSKKLFLGFPSSYVHRRAGQEIDNIGIPPSIKLPIPKDQQAYDDEIKFAQKYLEKN